jgi:molybdate transport system ATP-binding protein
MLDIELRKSIDRVRLDYRFHTRTGRMVLFGPSGAGKSLLLKMIAGFFNPDRGRIVVGDRVFFDSSTGVNLPVHRRRVGYLPQEYTLFPNMTIRQNILYGPRVQKTVPDLCRLQRLIETLDIDGLLDRKPHQLSGGQQQRVALARILMIDPTILLLDEPFSALDAAIRESLRDLVIDLVDELAIPALLVTHDLEEAFIFGQELILMQQGVVIEYGQTHQVYHRPTTIAAARLMGIPNIFSIRDVADGQVEIDSGHRFRFTIGLMGRPEYLCIRPEEVMVVRPDIPDGSESQHNVVSGCIEGFHYRGRYIKIDFRSADSLRLQIHLPVHAFHKMALEKGADIRVSLKEEALVFCQSDAKTEGITK